MEPSSMSLGELRKALADYPDEARLYFGFGDLSFNRVRNHGDSATGGKLLQVEFKEAYETQKQRSDQID
jgi:hypothetical protein